MPSASPVILPSGNAQDGGNQVDAEKGCSVPGVEEEVQVLPVARTFRYYVTKWLFECASTTLTSTFPVAVPMLHWGRGTASRILFSGTDYKLFKII